MATTGDIVQVFYRDKWQPAVFLEAGRKWAWVKLNGKEGRTKVIIDRIKDRPKVVLEVKPTSVVILPAPSATSEPASPEPATSEPAIAKLTLTKDDGWNKIKRGNKIIAIIPGAYKEEAEIMFKALEETKIETS